MKDGVLDLSADISLGFRVENQVIYYEYVRQGLLWGLLSLLKTSE